MATVFESKLPRGFADLIEADERLFISSGFRRGVLGVYLELPEREAADMAEALLRHLGEDTARSVFESVVGKSHANVVSHSSLNEEVPCKSSTDQYTY